MSGRGVGRVGLVMNGQPVDDRLAGLVEADQFDFSAPTAKLQHDGIQRRHAGNISDMRLADIDHHPVEELAEIEGLGEILDRGEKQLSANPIGAAAAILG